LHFLKSEEKGEKKVKYLQV